jgi:hypothetical protein
MEFTMNCRRCAGLMHRLTIGDHLNESGQIWVGVWQCYNCGEIVDSLILQNRKSVTRPKGGKARLKTFSPSRQTIRKDVQRMEP